MGNILVFFKLFFIRFCLARWAASLHERFYKDKDIIIIIIVVVVITIISKVLGTCLRHPQRK